MTELAAPTLDDLQESAPLHDFIRPAEPGYAGEVLRVRVPAACDWRLAATFVVLLSRHARRSSIAVVWAVDGPARTLMLHADQPFDGLEAQLRDAASAAAVRAWPCGQRVPGVLFERAGRCSGIEADLTVRLPAGEAPGELAWDRRLFERLSIEPLRRQWLALLAAASRGTPAAWLPMLDAAERARVLSCCGGERLPLPAGATVAGLIEEQVRRTPEAVCAVHRDRMLHFGELDEAANRMARLLVERGVCACTHVAIVDERGLDFLTAIVAIWKAGAAYVPIDPGYPADRVRYMLEDCEAPVAVVGRPALDRFADVLAACPTLRDLVCPTIDEDDAVAAVGGRLRVAGRAVLARTAGDALPARCRAIDPAYTIYTSGSTGRPKGAIVRHDGAVNHLYAQAYALGSEAVSRFLQSAPSSSDISVWQFAAPLVFGGTTVIVDDPTDVAALLRGVQRYRLSLVELVPSLLRWFVAYAASLPPAQRALPDLRWMIVTGEPAPAELVNAWLALYPDVPVINAYGPTEAADDVANAVIRRPLPPGRCCVPIGRPLANLDLYVLDSALEPLPVGVPGEICIAGIGVGNGYWKQPEKTRQAFVPNPFGETVDGPVIYRTGDLGRWRDDGTLECLGRLDHQVRLRGHRIELQEIEHVLASHPAVAQAAVTICHEARSSGEVMAFLVMRTDAQACDNALRDHCAARLPAYMLPTSFVRLAAMPLNPAGKLDRQALKPPPRTKVVIDGDGDAGLRDDERQLLALWRQELGAARAGVDDDFFALGGDSLSALAIAVGASREDLRLRSADVLAHPTVARLAAFMRAGAKDAQTEFAPATAAVRAVAPLPYADRERYLQDHEGIEDVRPQDPPQLGIFLHALLAEDKRAYVDQYAYRVHGALDVAAFESAWQRVLARHGALRTAFVRRGVPQPVQVTHRAVSIDVPLLDLSALARAARDAAVRDAALRELSAGFDLSRAPLMRLLLVREGPGTHTLIWTHHHLILDGWSLALVLDEVRTIHDALHEGRSPALPDVVPRSRYCDWIAAHDIAPAEAFWRAQLAGAGAAPPWQLPPPPVRLAGLGQIDLSAGPIDADALAAAAARHRVTPTTLLQAAWAVVLRRLTGRDDVITGVASSGRELPVEGIGRMVGLFVTSLPLRVDLRRDGGDGPTHWLGQLQRRAAALRAHEAVPLSRITRWAGLGPGQGLFDTLVVTANYHSLASRGTGALSIEPGAFRTMPAFPLSLLASPGHPFGLRLIHDRRRLDGSQAMSLGEDLVRALGMLLAGKDPRPPAQGGARPVPRGGARSGAAPHLLEKLAQ